MDPYTPDLDDDPPRLTEDIISDDALLGEAVDALLERDLVARDRQQAIVLHHSWLAAAVEPEVWQLFLHIEALTNESHSDALVVVAKWAYQEGRASRGTAS